MISIITPIAYDYKYAFNALKCYYDIADEIILGVDSDNISWSGNKYYFNDLAFKNFIAELDINHKIKVIKDNFHGQPSPLENDTLERNKLSAYCNPNNWIISIDSDEYILNPIEFRTWLSQYKSVNDFHAEWLTVFKIIDKKCLVVLEPLNSVPFGTKKRCSYVECRDTRSEYLKSNAKLLHYSWGRSRYDLELKLKNWSHSKDFDINRYLKFWDSVNLDNYKIFNNFHPLYGPLWHSLHVCELPL